MVLRRGLAHRTELVLLAEQVTDDERRLGLAEALHDAETGIFLKYFINLRVERLACGRRMYDRGQVVFADVLLDQHAVHGRRRAKCRDVVLREHRKDVLSMEAVEVVHEDRRLAQPLAVELAPQSLAPAGVGDGQVQTVGVNLMPILGGYIVAERVEVAVACDLRVAGRARREEHNHGILALSAVLRAIEVRAVERVFVVKCSPPLAGAVDRDLDLDRRARQSCDVCLLCGVARHGAEDRLDACGLETIFKVMREKLVRRGDRDRAELMQREHRDPELIVAAKNEHDAVALLDA